MTKEEALKLALEALEKNNNDWKRLADSGEAGWWTAEETELYKQTEQAIISIKEALAKPQQEPVRLRRGNILRCIETNELCTVWSTSTTGKTLVKWGANSFGEYTAEQIGELFWLEPEPDNLELAAEKSDNYAAFHAGYRFAVAHHLAQPEQEPVAWMNNKDFEPIRVRIMQEAYELADRNDSEGYNAIKVMCGDVQRMLPPQRTWVDLTHEQFAEILCDDRWRCRPELMLLQVQDKLKNKNL